jgi:hypothetical protein
MWQLEKLIRRAQGPHHDDNYEWMPLNTTAVVAWVTAIDATIVVQYNARISVAFKVHALRHTHLIRRCFDQGSLHPCAA